MFIFFLPTYTLLTLHAELKSGGYNVCLVQAIKMFILCSIYAEVSKDLNKLIAYKNNI